MSTTTIGDEPQFKIFYSGNRGSRGLCGIYSITDLENGLLYIGQTKDYVSRSGSHKRELRKGTHKNRYLQRAYNKGHRFIMQFIEDCLIEELDSKEVYWIGFLKTMTPDGYNLCLGGNSPRGAKHTQEVKDQKRDWMLEYRKTNKVNNSDRYKPVLCYDLQTGNFLSEHVSIANAATENNVSIPYISGALNGRLVAPSGIIFTYKTEKDYPLTIDNTNYLNRINNWANNGALRFPVEEYCDNNLIKTWYIKDELLNHLGLTLRGLQQRLQRGKGEFIFNGLKYIRKCQLRP